MRSHVSTGGPGARSERFSRPTTQTSRDRGPPHKDQVLDRRVGLAGAEPPGALKSERDGEVETS
jgi:hypothetical protein